MGRKRKTVPTFSHSTLAASYQQEKTIEGLPCPAPADLAKETNPRRGKRMELGCYVLWETQRLLRRAWAASYSSENARAGKRGDFGLPPLLVEPQGHVAVV